MQLLIHRRGVLYTAHSSPRRMPRGLRSPFSRRRRLKLNPSKTDFIATSPYIFHNNLIKQKTPQQRLTRIVITWGAIALYHPISAEKICPSFPSITRTSRRILISAAISLKLRNRKIREKVKPPFFPNTMGYLRSSSPQTRTTRLLSQSRKSSYSSQRGKNLNTKTILPQTTEFVNTAHENILIFCSIPIFDI